MIEDSQEEPVFIHCAKCQTYTETHNLQDDVSKNGRPMLKGNCTYCGTRKSTFVKFKK